MHILVAVFLYISCGHNEKDAFCGLPERAHLLLVVPIVTIQVKYHLRLVVYIENF